MKKGLKGTGLILLSLVMLIGIYFAAAFVLSRIGIEKEADSSEDVEIYILTNGVHVDIVVPVRSELVDWSKQIRYDHTIGNDSSMQYLALGWGDKGFYLETPTWADLKFSVAVKAATGMSTSAIHATYYRKLEEGENCKKIYISKEQYARLVNYIQQSFKTDAQGNVINIKTTANYGGTDAFYEAKKSYSLFHTCNTWANNALKSCGQKACWWTPFDTGIFYQYMDID